MKFWHWLLWSCFFSQAIASPSAAQVIPDSTTNTVTNPTNNGTIIETGDRAGNNLFHSFREFSVPNGSGVFFNNPNDIVNIFSRVTGGNISNIDGLIRANGPANLFLINPAGIVFGEGAALDIGGSFMASTAESIVFADNIEFSTIDTNNQPLLTINQPLGLNFGNKPGNIAINGSNLQVNSGATLALFGGNVTITGGQIVAPGANIELGGLKEAGQISFEQLETISFPQGIARGDITLANGTEVNVQASGGGNIRINADNLQILGGELGESSLNAGIAAESNLPEAQAGDIILDISEDIILTQSSIIGNRVEQSGVGNAGRIELTTTNLSLTEGSRIDTSTLGEGNAGTINIFAADSILVSGEDGNDDPGG